MTETDNSAYAYIASDISQHSLKSTHGQDLAIAETAMVSDPVSLFDRLMAVKPEGLSLNAWRTQAGLSNAVFTDIKRRNAANHRTIEKLLDAIGVTFAEFEAGVKQPDKEPPSPAARAPRMAFQGNDRPRDVPVVGTAECGDVEFDVDNHPVSVESMMLDLDDVVDYVRRPISLDSRRDAYAIYFQGTSMAPRYEDGEIAYVDPKRPPSRLDYVVIQLRAPDVEEGERVVRVLAKRLVRNTAAYVELEQFNPPLTFRVPKAQVKHMHRIWPWEELVAF